MANPYIVIEQKDEKKKRGALAIILAIAFVAILAIGGTFAYLTYTANQTPNRFTTDPNITADVLEPMWTNAIDTSASNTYKASDGTAVPEKADNMMPGDEVAKNPFVVNTSKNGSDEYVALKLQFQKYVQPGENASATDDGYVNMTSEEVDKLFAVYAFGGTESAATGTKDTNAGWTTPDEWTQIVYASDTAAGTTDGSAEAAKGVTAGKANSNGSMYFYYNSSIAAETTAQAQAEKASTTITSADGDVTKAENYWNIDSSVRTSPLFTFVRYANGATQDKINALNNVLKGGAGKSAGDTGSANYTTDPGWRVVISGAAIQATADNAAADHAKTGTTENWIDLLDANKTTDGSSTTSKPTTVSGVRTDSGVTSPTSKIPEATNVKKDGTES